MPPAGGSELHVFALPAWRNRKAERSAPMSDEHEHHRLHAIAKRMALASPFGLVTVLERDICRGKPVHACLDVNRLFIQRFIWLLVEHAPSMFYSEIEHLIHRAALVFGTSADVLRYDFRRIRVEGARMSLDADQSVGVERLDKMWCWSHGCADARS